MSITFSSDNSIVHITNGKISYVMEILDNKYLIHRYFGKSIRAWHGSNTLIPFKRSYTIEYPEKIKIYILMTSLLSILHQGVATTVCPPLRWQAQAEPL